MLKKFLRVGLLISALSALVVLSACTWTVQPEGEMPSTDTPSAAAPSTATPEPEMTGQTVAEFVLHDGTSCLFSGTGATVAFDGKRVYYTCTPVDATDTATQTLALLNEPVIAGPTEYLVDFATIGRTDGGFELHASRAITFTAWQIVLDDGRECFHAGFGATMGFDGKRLNYTCDKGDSTADEVGLMGELSNAGAGVWLAQIDEIGRDANGFVQLSSNLVPVARVSGMEIRFDEDRESKPVIVDVNDALQGTTWYWMETQYGDDSVLTASDPSRYTLNFSGASSGAGQVAVQLDCNSGSADYTVDGSTLIFGAIISTLMGCPEGSQATEFANDLAEIYSYVIEDGHLYLSLKLDAGIMEFAPMDEMAEADSTPDASEEAANGELVGTSWQWEQSIYERDMTLMVDDPSRYTITLHEDGTVAVKLDCNNGSSSYRLDGTRLTFGPITSTRMGCPADSQAAAFSTDLAAVTSYVMADGNLHLTLGEEDGVMEFSPVE